jgi:glycerophosphoryl diester phosphodiesterase
VTERHPSFLLARRPYVFAHRGGRAIVPENTLAGFDRAIDLGVDGLELDVRLSRDSVPIVHHDETVDRTTNATGKVSGWTSGDLAGLDAAFHFAQDRGYPLRGKGIGVPTLRAVLQRYAEVPLIVEMKGEDPRLPEATLAEVRAAGALDRVCFAGFNTSLLRAVRRSESAATTSAGRVELRSALYRSWIWWRLGTVSYDVCQVPDVLTGRPFLSRRFVRLVRRAGIPVQVWTVNEAADVCRLLDWSVDAFITDRPDAVRGWICDWEAGRAEKGSRPLLQMP